MPRSISLISIAINCAVALTQVANADSELNCTFKSYNIGATAVDIAKSYIPESQRHFIGDDKTALHLDFGLDGNVTKDNSERVDFQYEFVNNNTPIKLKYIFFRTTKKVSATMVPTGYQNIGPIWGLCDENKNVSGNYIRYSEANDEQVCNEVTLGFGNFIGNIQITNDDGTIRNQEWIDEAKRRWGEDYGTKCNNILNTSQGSSSSTSSSKLDKAKTTCTELGFTAGTEKHGNCVLKMMDN